jgi:NAD(P)-dependent dehydrogenase (short-subunit alcohol dehydrogenase family)
MMDAETASLHAMPEPARDCSALRGVRGYRCCPRRARTLPAWPPPRCEMRRAHARGTAVAGAAAAEEHEAPAGALPRGSLDQDLQQIDLRERNSWRLLMHEVPSVELLEVQLVNAVAPFLLNARLKPLMLRTPERDKHIVNVSAVEGQFYRNFKTTRHPHTNMAKAALNMMTRTSAPDYFADGIHMNSVDTGWVTDEDRPQIAARKDARSIASIRRSTSWTARRASSIRSSMGSTRASTCGGSSSRTTRPPTGKGL